VSSIYENLHFNALKELQKLRYRWHIRGIMWALYGYKGQQLLDWRLWESIENLDIQLSYVKDLLKRAKGQKWQKTREALKQVAKLYDEALSIIDPEHWRGNRKRFLDIKPTVENVTGVLKRLIEIRRLIYVNRLDLARLEQHGDEWMLITFMLYIDVLDSIYGCKKWLKEAWRVTK